jgi:CHAT domain-containing protein
VKTSIDPGRADDGFLVEQFPVVRWVRGRRPTLRVELSDVRYVLPPGSPAADLVFMNACRSAGQAPAWTSLSCWAQAFHGAGAGAFIGSSWAVRDSSARTFAEHVYGRLAVGDTLGAAVTDARTSIVEAVDDSSWLAYTVYGDLRLRVVDPVAALRN